MTGRDGEQVFEGVDWRGSAGALPLRPNVTVRFSDLRGCSLAGLDLTRVQLIGCRLNGASFAGAQLAHARIVGCFAADDLPAVDFRGARWDRTEAVNSHLHALRDGSEPGPWRWPAEVAAATAGILAERSDTRYQACQRLAALGDQRPVLVLAGLLADPHWEVRAAAVNALGALYQGGVPHANDELLAWIFHRLGDEHSLVRMAARRLIPIIGSPQHLLPQAAHRMTAAQPLARLEAVRAAIELVRHDERFSRAIGRHLIDGLLTDDAPAIRAEALHLLGILDDSREPVWRRALADRDPGVRVKALEAMRLLSAPPSADVVLPLLRDPDPAVRLETLYALGQLDPVDPSALSEALRDESPEVRQAARQLMERAR